VANDQQWVSSLPVPRQKFFERVFVNRNLEARALALPFHLGSHRDAPASAAILVPGAASRPLQTICLGLVIFWVDLTGRGSDLSVPSINTSHFVSFNCHSPGDGREPQFQ